jgi:hypothetical protein
VKTAGFLLSVRNNLLFLLHRNMAAGHIYRFLTAMLTSAPRCNSSGVVPWTRRVSGTEG